MKKRNPAIKDIYLNGIKNTEWKYDRSTGIITFPNNLTKGTEVKVIFKESLTEKITNAIKRILGAHK